MSNTSTFLRRASVILASASRITFVQLGAASHPSSIMSVRGRVVMPSVCCKIGRAKAIARIAPRRIRKRSSHKGVESGVSSSVTTSFKMRSGGKVSFLGEGGVTRKINQIIGRASKPSKTRGAKKVIGPNVTAQSPPWRYKAPLRLHWQACLYNGALRASQDGWRFALELRNGPRISLCKFPERVRLGLLK